MYDGMAARREHLECFTIFCVNAQVEYSPIEIVWGMPRM